ncbi:MAG: Trm112 family protein [Terriglobales bacterium]
MAVSPELLKILVCPDDHAPVRLVNDGTGLQCDHCRRIYPIREDIPVMLIEEATLPAGDA